MSAEAGDRGSEGLRPSGKRGRRVPLWYQMGTGHEIPCRYVKYLICNADEGEVGTFKDRCILQQNPFILLEGMAITAYAIGAGKGYIYLRAEYRYLLEGLQNAIKPMRREGISQRSGDRDTRRSRGLYLRGRVSPHELHRGEAWRIKIPTSFSPSKRPF